MLAMDDIYVAYSHQDQKARAEALAKQFHLSIDNLAANQLLITSKGLWLRIKPFKPLQVDFSWPTWRKRLEQGKRQDLIKACKVKPGMTVIDTTAGWGRDAAILASFGAKVTLLERNPIMQALLEDGIARQTPVDQQHLSLHLIKTEAKQYLQTLSQPVDVIYLDPMHPQRQKSALVKKDLQALQKMIGPDQDVKPLFEVAMHCSCKRVILKWPIHLPPIHPPTLSWSGKTIRYDCYIIS